MGIRLGVSSCNVESVKAHSMLKKHVHLIDIPSLSSVCLTHKYILSNEVRDDAISQENVG